MLWLLSFVFKPFYKLYDKASRIANSTVDKASASVNKTFNTFSYLVKQLTIFVVLVLTLVWISVFLYGTFYYTYIPVVSLEKPVHFEFSVCEDGIGMCSFPRANISLSKEGENEVFMPGQSYRIVLDLHMPESSVNKQIGMFMVKLLLYDRDGQLVRVSSRSVSAILHYRSELLHVMETFFFAPLLLFRFSEQKQSIDVELFSNYVDETYKPSSVAVVEIQSKKIEIYSSTLRIHAEFSGLRYLLYHWTVTSALFGIGFNFTFLTFLVLLSWLHLTKEDSSKVHEDKDEQERRRNMRLIPRERSQGRRTETVGADRPTRAILDEEETTLLTPLGTDHNRDTDVRQRQANISNTDNL